MVFKGVIFDLDGTLIDTTHEIRYIFNQLLESYSLPKKSLDFFKKNIGNGVEDLLQRSLPSGYSRNISPMLEKVKEIYSENLNKKSRPFDGITEILDLLNENGVQIGIITNKMHHLAIRCVDMFFPSHLIMTIGAGHLHPRKPSHNETSHPAPRCRRDGGVPFETRERRSRLCDAVSRAERSFARARLR